MPLESGTMVTANVRLLSPIGEGAMGSVWLAEHLTLETEVAVKFIHDDLQANRNEAVARFQREAAVAAKIRSPHIVQVFDQGQMVDGTPYIVMELLQGESLDDRLARVQRLSMRQTAQIVSQVAKGLRAAHAAGVVHRDIKPANIFLVPHEDGKLIKLVDFGVAKAVKMPESRKLTQDGLLVGTPEYICRDQIASTAPADFRTDLWALAVVAYECLIGEVPFGGSTVGMVCANVLLGKFARPSTLRSDLPAGLDAWFDRCFAEDPANRFQSAREMALAFVRLLPTRTSDIEADLLERGTANFSLMPPPGGVASSRRGTEVGLASSQNSGTLPSVDEGDSDWANTDPDDDDDLALGLGRGDGGEPEARASSSSSGSRASKLRTTSSASGIASEALSLPVTRPRPVMLGAAALALVVVLVGGWLALRTPSDPASAASSAAPSSSAAVAPTSTPSTIPAVATVSPSTEPTAAATSEPAAAPAASSAATTATPPPRVAPSSRPAPPSAGEPKNSAGGKPSARPVVSKPSGGSGDDLGF
jgi:serine/threonine protein kinase